MERWDSRKTKQGKSTKITREEIVEENENGFVCPIRDTEYLKEKILSLYENRTKLNSFSEQAYEKSRKDLSWDKYGDNIVSIYNRLLNLK